MPARLRQEPDPSFKEVLSVVNIVPEMLSKTYDVRRLNMDDADMIFGFCRKNTQYYGYCGKRLSIELIENDMNVAPPGIPMAQKWIQGHC